MPLNHCFGCHCGLNGSVLDVFYFCSADFSLVHLHVKGPLFTASLPRGLCSLVQAIIANVLLYT